MNKSKSTAWLVRAGVISAVYVTLTLIFYPLSFSGVQVRFSEGLSLLPILFPESVMGLIVGCLISNFFGNGLLDIVFGTLATAIACVLTRVATRKIKNDWVKVVVGGIFPIVVNALIVPITFLGLTESFAVYIVSAVQVFIGQFIAVYLFGAPTYFICKKILQKK